MENIRIATNQGMVLGNEQFTAEIESLTGRRMTAKKMGRPVGWRKEKAKIDLSLLCPRLLKRSEYPVSLITTTANEKSP